MPPIPEGMDLPRLQNPRKPRPEQCLANLRPGQGRPRGNPNKITKDIKAGIVDAAIALGRDGKGTDGMQGYFEHLGWHHPRAFAGLMAKLIPLQVNSEVSTAMISAVNIISVPADTYLSPEDMQRLQGGVTPAIEHAPPAIASAPEPAPPLEPDDVAIENLKAELRALGHDRLLELARVLDVGQ